MLKFGRRSATWIRSSVKGNGIEVFFCGADRNRRKKLLKNVHNPVKGANVPPLNNDDFHNFKIGVATEDDDMPHNVLFSRNASNQLNCISAVCTHRPVLMSKALRTGDQLRCCSHGAIFNIETGVVKMAPATEPLRVYPCRLADDDVIEIDVDRYDKTVESVNKENHEKIVIIGSGAAAVTAAEELVANGYTNVTMITADDCAPYDRTLVSKRFAHVPYTSVVDDIDFITDYSLVNLDEQRKKVTIKNVQPKHSPHQKFATNYSCGPRKNWHLVDVDFDKLIIATGLVTTPVKPGGCSLYSARDAEHLIKSGVTKNAHIGVIGGSFLAVECVSGLAQKPQFEPASVTMFYETTTPFGHLFGDEIGTFVAEELVKLNIKLVPNTRVDPTGNHDNIDLFINAAGARPDTDFLTNAKLVRRENQFIVTNQHFQTDHDDIYAVGDVSVANGVNNQHWAYAQESGRSAAHHIMGKSAPGEMNQTMVWSAFGASKLHLRSAGRYLTEEGISVKYLTNGAKHVGIYYDQDMIVVGACTIDADPVVATFTEMPGTLLDDVLNNDAFGIQAVFNSSK